MISTKDKVWSANEDYGWDDDFSSMVSNNDLQIGDGLFEGEKSTPEFCYFVDTEEIIEGIQERAWDYAEEWAEEFTTNVSDEQKQELEDVICKWMEKYLNINFYRVINIKEITLTEDDL